MIIRLFLCSFILVLLYSCKNQTAVESKLYMCSCESVPDLGDSTAVVQKIKYTYIVNSDKLPDCCSEEVNTDYIGHKEVWINEAPEHPKVWRRPSANFINISATEAHSKGCAFEKKEVSVIDVKVQPFFIKEYYPDLTK